MKRLMILSGMALCLICAAGQASAQQRNGVTQGQLSMTSKEGKTSGLRYTLNLESPGTMIFMVYAESPVTVATRIVNEKGLEQLTLGKTEVQGRDRKQIDISKFAKGTYFIEVSNGSGNAAATKIPFSI